MGNLRSLREDLLILVPDVIEDLLRKVNEIHLVDGDQDLAEPEEPREVGVAPRLLHDAVPRVNQDDRRVGGRGSCDHVPRILDVPRRVGYDELSLRRREVAVGDIYGDALLALCPEAVCQEGEIHLVASAPAARLLDCLQLVIEYRLGIVQEPSYQCALSVIDASGGNKTQKFHVLPP